MLININLEMKYKYIHLYLQSLSQLYAKGSLLTIGRAHYGNINIIFTTISLKFWKLLLCNLSKTKNMAAGSQVCPLSFERNAIIGCCGTTKGMESILNVMNTFNTFDWFMQLFSKIIKWLFDNSTQSQTCGIHWFYKYPEVMKLNNIEDIFTVVS